MSPRGPNDPDCNSSHGVLWHSKGNAVKSGLGKPCMWSLARIPVWERKSPHVTLGTLSPCLVSVILPMKGRAGLTWEFPEWSFMGGQVLGLGEFGGGCLLWYFMACSMLWRLGEAVETQLCPLASRKLYSSDCRQALLWLWTLGPLCRSSVLHNSIATKLPLGSGQMSMNRFLAANVER